MKGYESIETPSDPSIVMIILVYYLYAIHELSTVLHLIELAALLLNILGSITASPLTKVFVFRLRIPLRCGMT